MKKSLTIALCCATALAVCSCGGSKARKAAEAVKAEAEAVAAQVAADTDSATVATKTMAVADRVAALPEEPVFDIITNMGVIKVKLYADTPKHRENFAKLALSGFYDGILFHRVINGFMIQAGDPLTKDASNAKLFGTGGPGYNVPAEILPEYHHKKGALAAARRGDAANPLRESSGSQFYLVQDEANCAQLDGAYTVFGETVEGLDIIDRIAAVQTGPRDLPVGEVKIINIKLDDVQ